MSTLADANEHRDWRIYADFTQVLINSRSVVSSILVPPKKPI